MLGLPSLGSLVEKGLDALGAPEWAGDIASGAVNLATGNVPAAISDGLDLAPNVARGLGKLGLPTEQLAPLLEYADDLYSLGGPGALLDKIVENKDKLLGFVDGAKEFLDSPVGELLKEKLGDTDAMLGLLSNILSAKKDAGLLTQALAIRG